MKIFDKNHGLLGRYMDSFPQVANSTATPHKFGKSGGRVAAANKNLLSTDVSLKNFTRDPNMTVKKVSLKLEQADAESAHIARTRAMRMRMPNIACARSLAYFHVF